MATRVYAWPPVGVTGAEWTIDAPVNVSRSIITGARKVSAHARKRRLVSLTASSLARGKSGAGYMEALKRFISGGENLVRVNSYPINRVMDARASAASRQSQPVVWQDGGSQVDWESGGSPVLWYSGTVLTGVASTDADGWPVLTVSGLAPNVLVARPAEFVTLFSSGMTGATAQIVREAYSNASGVAVLRLFTALSGSGRVNIGVSESAVFEAVSIPRAVQPVTGDWTYSWGFREVFADEVGGFEEINPW